MEGNMKNIGQLLLTLFAIAFGAEPLLSQEYKTSLYIHTPFTPKLVKINGKYTAYYELHLTNFSEDTIELKELEIHESTNSQLLISVEAQELKKMCQGVGAKQTNNHILIPGASSILYVELTLNSETIQPVHIEHHFEVVLRKTNTEEFLSIKCTPLVLLEEPLTILGPPLGHGTWAAVYEPSWKRGHRRVIYTVDGKARIPGRFAIDFIKLDDHGRYSTDNENVIKNWHGYGVDVLAAADGVVVSVGKEFSESQTLSDHPKYPAEKATGNYVSIEISNGNVIFYEHLKPNSISVEIGQRVKKGDVIGSLGFTGQTTGPHLHIHVANKNSPLGAEGVPFVFENFILLGGYTDFSKFGKEIWKSINAIEYKNEKPPPNSVVKFHK